MAGFLVMAAVRLSSVLDGCDVACVGNAQEGVEFQGSRDCSASHPGRGSEAGECRGIQGCPLGADL